MALSNGSMSNLHSYVPCHTSATTQTDTWYLAVAAITHSDCEKDVTEKACCRSIYTFCNSQVYLNLETAGQARLNCYPIFHKACKQKLCHLANRPSHACIYSMLWRFKQCFWRRNATQHMGLFCSLYMG